MTDREERKKLLREKSKRAKREADVKLAAELEAIRQANTADLEALKPKLSDPEAFDALVAAVQESTAANETKAQLRGRVKALGEGVLKVAKEVIDLL